jgi:anthranilate phosphoribosyltransferase
MQSLIQSVRNARELSPAECEHAVDWLADPGANADEKGAFLTALREKGETAGEIAGFVEALLNRAVDPCIRRNNLSGPVIDVCGTGGDRLELFNVSTASMFVLAACGAVVVKHGNRAITSQCGGADVLEELGVKIDTSPEQLADCVEELGLGFVFAQSYHPVFKVIGPVRKTLAERGQSSIFNLLGPLLNPVRPAYQLVGVYAKELLGKYAEALHGLRRSGAWVVHGAGADELTPAGPCDVIAVSPAGLSQMSMDPASIGVAYAPMEALRGGGRLENASILRGILSCKVGGAKCDAVLLNAAAGLVVCGLASDMVNGMDAAREALQSGRALAKLDALCLFSK